MYTYPKEVSHVSAETWYKIKIYRNHWSDTMVNGYSLFLKSNYIPDSKVHGAHLGPNWGRQDPGGPHENCYLGYSHRYARMQSPFHIITMLKMKQSAPLFPKKTHKHLFLKSRRHRVKGLIRIYTEDCNGGHNLNLVKLHVALTMILIITSGHTLCKCHNSWATVPCVNLRPDWIIGMKLRTKYNSHKISMMSS